MTRFDWGSKGLLVTSLVLVTSLPSMGCRSGGGWSSVPPMAWFNRKKEKQYDTDGWASFDGASEGLTPSAESEPTGIEPRPDSGTYAASGAAGGQTASFESTDGYPRTSSPNPYSGMEANHTTSPAAYEQTARRETRELWNMSPPSTPAPPAASASEPPQTDGAAVAPQHGFYTHQAPPADAPPKSSTPTAPPAMTGDVPPWSPPPSSPAPGPMTEGPAADLPPWAPPEGATPPAGPNGGTAPADGGAMNIPPSWLKTQPPASPVSAETAPQAAASLPTQPWGPGTLRGSDPAAAATAPAAHSSAPAGTPARSSAPWRPGSTSDYVPQGPPAPASSSSAPTHQSYRPAAAASLSRAAAPPTDQQPLTLAVDDRFPSSAYR